MLILLLLVVSDGGERTDVRTVGGERGRQQQPVVLVDLARAKLFARPAQLRSRGQNRDARPAGAYHFGQSGRRERTDLRGAETNTGRHDHITRTDVAAARTNVVTLDDRGRNLHLVVMLDNVLDGDDGVGSLRHHAARGNRHRLACIQRTRGRDPGGNARDDGEPAGRVRRPYGETVHRRARERRQVDRSRSRRRRDPARGVSVQQKLLDEKSGDYRLAKYSNVKLNSKVADSAFKLRTTSKTNPNSGSRFSA